MKTILIDLDGVLNEYTGDFDPDFIPPIKKGAREFVEELSKKFEIKLFTTRNRLTASKWLIENNLDQIVKDVTNVKELSHLHIDDRCVRFQGDYSKTLDEAQKFEPWYKLNY